MDPLEASAMSLPGVEVRTVGRCPSTNTELLSEAPSHPVLLAAEVQSAGRGRRGRRWYASPGSALTFSLCRAVRRPPRELPGLSLIAGVAVVTALRALGARPVALKWPNDLVVGEAKLGGILVETRMQGDAVLAVIGIGINCHRDARLGGRVRRGVTCLAQCTAAPSRSHLIAAVATKLVQALERFEAAGFAPTRPEWEALDAFAGKRMRVRFADGRVLAGVAGGLAEDGALRLLTARGVRAVHSGRVVAARPLIMERP